MKQNKYDEQTFFDQYKNMDRSIKGLEGAGEWHALKNILPSFDGKMYWTWAAALAGIVAMLLKTGPKQ